MSARSREINWSTRPSTSIVKKGKAISLVNQFLRKDGKLLDIGAGNGLFGEQLRRKEIEYLLTDRKQYIKDSSLRFKVMDANGKFGIGSGSQDMVTAWNTLSYLGNPLNFFEESYRVLKSGGHLIFSIPNIHSISSKVSFLFRDKLSAKKQVEGRRSIYSERTIKEFFDCFEILENGYWGTEFPLLDRVRWIKFRLPRSKYTGQGVYYVLRKI